VVSLSTTPSARIPSKDPEVGKKIANAIFSNHINSQPSAFSPVYLCFYSVIPFGMVFANAAVRRSRSHLVAAITKRKNHANPLRGQGSLSAFASYGVYLLHQRRSAVGSVMAGLVAYGFSPSGGGRRAEASEAPAPTPLFAGKNKGGLSNESCLLPSGFFQFSYLWGVFGKNRLSTNFSYFLTAIFKY